MRLPPVRGQGAHPVRDQCHQSSSPPSRDHRLARGLLSEAPASVCRIVGGEVIGMTTFGSLETATGGLAAGFNFAIPVSVLNEFFRIAEVSPLTAQEKGSKQKYYLYLLIGAVLIASIGLVKLNSRFI